MEIVLSLKKFSFYSSNGIAYICGTVFRKTEITSPTPTDKILQELTQNSVINLKYDCEFDPEKVKILVTERIVKIRCFEVLKPTDPNRSHTFVASSLQACEL